MRALWRAATPLLALSFAAAPVAAQESSDATDLEGLLETPVVSAASKTAESVSIAPATSIVLTADDLKRYGIRTLDEAINFLAYGMVTERNFQAAEIGSRGVLLTSDFGAHVLLMVDGNIVNEQWGATAYFDRGTTIPFDIIDHIELVLGPGSVLYGSNAMLGIVHIVTKRAKDYAGAHLVAETELVPPGGAVVSRASEVPVSARVAGGIGKEFRLFDHPGEVVFEAEHFQQFGPTYDFPLRNVGPDSVTGAPRQYSPGAPPGYWGGRGSEAYYTVAPSAYLRARLGDFELGARAALYKRTDPTDSGNFDDPNSYEIDRFLHVDLKHTATLSPAFRLSTRLYGDFYDYRQYWRSNGAEDCLPGQDSGCLWRLYGSARWVGLEPQANFDWLEDGRFVTLVGVDGRVRFIRSDVNYYDYRTNTSPGAIGAYDLQEKLLAAYVQQTAWPTDWLGLNAGARFDDDQRFGTHVSPRAAASVLPWKGGTVKATYSEAFRAPTAFDIYYYDPTTQLPGGSGLGPETVRSVEGSVEERFGAQTLTMGVFRSWWSGLILIQQISDADLQAAIASGRIESTTQAAYQSRNVSTVDNWGYNVAVDGALVGGKLHYGASFTEAIARRSDPGKRPDLLAVAPNAFGNVRLAYDLSGGFPTLAVAAHWMSRRPIDDYPDTPVFAPQLFEVRGTISGAVPRVSGLSYRVTANYVPTSRGAYRAGPTLDSGKTELVPNDPLRFGVGLAYDLPL